MELTGGVRALTHGKGRLPWSRKGAFSGYRLTLIYLDNRRLWANSMSIATMKDLAKRNTLQQYRHKDLPGRLEVGN